MEGEVFIIGFSGEEVELLRSALLGIGVHEIPKGCLDWTLGEVIEKKPSGRGNWHERKFLVIHGDNETIKFVISKVRAMKLGRVIFVSTTPISLGRRLDDLIREWIEEDEYFRAFREMKRKAAGRKGPYLEV
ncbi:DUF3783 domain-containing protein [Thermococcus sp.]